MKKNTKDPVELSEPTIVSREDVLWQVGKLIDEYQFLKRIRLQIKGWAITVSTAVLIGIATHKLVLSLIGAIVLVGLPVVAFWILEAMYAAIGIHREQQIQELEKRLAKGNLSLHNPLEIYFMSRYLQFNQKDSFKAAFQALFREETVWIFYAGLMISSVLFVLLFSDGGLLV